MNAAPTREERPMSLSTSSRAPVERALAALRERGHTALAATAWPTPRLEAWRYTSVRAVERALRDGVDADALDDAIDAGDAGADAWAWPLAATQTVSDTRVVGGGVRIVPFAAAEGDDAALIETWLGQLAPVEGPEFAVSARNASAAGAGRLVVVEGEAPAPIVLALEATSRAPALAAERLLIVVQRNARATLVTHQTAVAGSVAMPVNEIVLEPGARLEHIVVQDCHRGAHHLETAVVHVGDDATYAAAHFAFGAAIGRFDLRVRLQGRGASCSLDGLSVAAGAQHHDVHVEVDHLGEHTTSAQRFKALLDDRAVGVFRGNVRIAQAARFASATQLSRSLLLSERARAHAKPQLEIDNEDVQASHGATVGQLDADQLFYLQARGLSPALARQLLVAAFAAEIVDHLPRHAGLEDLCAALEARVGVLREEAEA